MSKPGDGVTGRFKRWLINGIALTIPLVITILALILVVDFVLGVLSPVVRGVMFVWPNEPPEAVVQFVTMGSLLAFFLLVGIAAEYTPGTAISQRVHATMETIPGVSTIYESVRRASKLLVDDDTDQFQDVKLVEFPHRDAYMLGFLTAQTPPDIEAQVGNGPMVTIMVPLGPNPTTNGFVMHMPAEHVYDVDVTVEEAFRVIATLGVASDDLGDDT
ncbi:DUF502 domain-containing protein [Haloterrigena sp. SYSU A558-1]|uniref:DUF502 domain-containing protein n=1 Tax=Haloterrigena gelatinilytica TaxID=2741724 RepID=A0A8J8GMH0_9EURY|nr:DUF502 domain-containing protein [Haloterrigena gelatinilytica]NUB90440.1 DUF502 domain-containing protein [Haloterrigena gelatinilytica]NUC73742.1 DUF502 domain-containing protein [Haloterrigena gelatinilytica]